MFNSMKTFIAQVYDRKTTMWKEVKGLASSRKMFLIFLYNNYPTHYVESATIHEINPLNGLPLD